MPWITPDGNYYDAGGPVADGSVEVPERPSKLHCRVNGEWVIDAVKNAQYISCQIEEIEQKTKMNRATREFLIALAEEKGAALGLTPTQLAIANKGYAAVKAIESQIVELRNQL